MDKTTDKIIAMCSEYVTRCGSSDFDKDILESLDNKDAEFEAGALLFKDTKTLLQYHEGMKKIFETLPDFWGKVEYASRDGDMVSILERGGAHYTGKPLFGVEVNGKEMKWVTLWLFYTKNGKITKAVKGWDQQSTFLQVGWEFPPKVVETQEKK